MGAYGRALGKIATPQILLKLEQALVKWTTKYGMKYFSRAVSRLTCRGQIDIQITWEPMGEMSGKLHHFRIHSYLGIKMHMEPTFNV